MVKCVIRGGEIQGSHVLLTKEHVISAVRKLCLRKNACRRMLVKESKQRVKEVRYCLI